MCGIGREHRKLGEIVVHHFHHLAALGVGHAGIRLTAIGYRLLQRSDQVRFAGLVFFDPASGRSFAYNRRTKEVLGIGEVADQLPETPNIRGRLKRIIRFRHFLGSSDDDAAEHGVHLVLADRNGISGC